MVMTRHPVVQGALNVGWSLAALKGFQRLLRRYLSDEWLFLDWNDKTGKKIADVSTGTKPSHSIVVDNSTNELGWAQVLSFVINQIVHMDSRLAVAILILAVVAPLVPYLVGYDEVDTDGEEPEAIASHLDPAQRALLQFGKSKSEPILLRFMSMELGGGTPVFEYAHELQQQACRDLQEEIRIAKRIVRKQEFKELDRIKQREKREVCSFSRSFRIQESDVSTAGKPSSSTKSDCISPGASTPPFDQKDSCVSHSKVWIQLRSFKTSNPDAQLTSEQVYSQPFIY